MKTMDATRHDEICRWHEKLFERSVRRQARLRRLRQLLGNTANQECLEITAGDPVISSRLRDSGGAWQTLTLNPGAETPLAWFIGSGVKVLSGAVIDAPDHAYDVVVITDALERVRDDRGFIKECHRVLKPDGRLVIHTLRKGFLCPDSWIRPKRDLERPGYTAHEFFDVLKDGFDVPETETYSTCCFELLGVMGELIANKITGGPYTQPGEDANTEQFYHYRHLRFLASLAFPLIWLLAKIDSTLFFLPGRWMVAKTKRRVWRERRAPVLMDGRSIAEAALNTKIGTAAPF